MRFRSEKFGLWRKQRPLRVMDLPNDQFITRLAFTAEDACKLVDVGFEYITGEYNDGGKIFRKRK